MISRFRASPQDSLWRTKNSFCVYRVPSRESDYLDAVVGRCNSWSLVQFGDPLQSRPRNLHTFSRKQMKAAG